MSYISLYSIDSILNTELLSSFLGKVKALKFLKENQNNYIHLNKSWAENKVAALLFLEPSTRTRLSFEMAIHRMGMKAIVLSDSKGTSLSKGESHRDTLETIVAMDPDILIIRHSGCEELEVALTQLNIPIINAGNGVLEHPTQALLDFYTIWERRGDLFKAENERILFIGDVKHSRVVGSSYKLYKSLGIQMGVCAQSEFLPENRENWIVFDKLEEGLRWCTVCIGLRIQSERHEVQCDDYIKKYRLDSKSINFLSPEALILNPGPYTPNIELTDDVLKDRRSCIREQVRNGVFVRAALLELLLNKDGGNE